jgi:acetyltransferase-like isoleucine patch superfamily enzyme
MKKTHTCKGSIIGYPRSGNNWLRYLVEYFTKYETVCEPANTPMRKPLHLLCPSIDSVNKDTKDNDALWNTHGHEPGVNKMLKKAQGKQILILRNYKECIPRHINVAYPFEIYDNNFKDTGKLTNLDLIFNEANDGNSLDLIHYLSLLNDYYNYEGEKLLLYYEDLINKETIKESLIKLINFLDGDITLIDAFLDTYEERSNECKVLYKPLGGSQSPAGQSIFHSKVFTDEQKYFMDDLILSDYSHLTDYVKCYFEDRDIFIHSDAEFKIKPELGDHIAIDKGVYCTVNAKIGSYTHISPYTTIIGGKTGQFECKGFNNIMAGARIVCGSDRFDDSGLFGALIPKDLKGKQIIEPVIMERFSNIGTNSIVLPGSILREGVLLAAGSLLIGDTEPWGVYKGNPAKLVKVIDGSKIKENAKQLMADGN